MKVIDLLNKIANGEEVPKKIIYENDIYIHMGNYCYYCDETNLILTDRVFAEHSKLNEEIEIIEEDKEIEKLAKNITDNACATIDQRTMANKINELIDVVNELKKG